LESLARLRNRADYDLRVAFADPVDSQDAVNRSTVALALLDTIDADPIRRAAVIADIRARWP
jgi:hypothetical protein